MQKELCRFVDYIIEVENKRAAIYISDELVYKPAIVRFQGQEIYRGRLPHVLFLQLPAHMSPEVVGFQLHIKTVLFSELRHANKNDAEEPREYLIF
uniref:Uncharacterized protein n=1 Tax=Fervidobacterium pennivorans TaxID=93466 RepID=A0A7V4NF92_FERPE